MFINILTTVRALGSLRTDAFRGQQRRIAVHSSYSTSSEAKPPSCGIFGCCFSR